MFTIKKINNLAGPHGQPMNYDYHMDRYIHFFALFERSPKYGASLLNA